MKTKNQILTALLIILCQNGFSQSFVNLDFESANPSGYPVNSMNVPTTLALPGWTAYYSQPTYGVTNAPLSQVWYDGLSAGGGMISINDANTGFGFAQIQGNFSAFLFGGINQMSVGISQTGLIPSGTQSLQMDIGKGGVYANYTGVFTVQVNGQAINMIPLEIFSTYTLYGGDITSFANQVATLAINAEQAYELGGPNPVLLDDIVFSSESVPEPGELALAALGTFLFGFRRWRNSPR